MIGTLYIIKNKLNNKVYIGKTYKTLNRRWKEHINDYKRNKPYKLYNAIRKLGVENFYIEELGKYEEGILEQKEIEYIEKYNSFINGYNMTFGGDGYRRLTVTDQEILNSYKQLKSEKLVAESLQISLWSVQKVLSSYNIKNNINNRKAVYYLDCKRTFLSIKDVAIFLKEEYNKETKILNIQIAIYNKFKGSRKSKYFNSTLYKILD